MPDPAPSLADAVIAGDRAAFDELYRLTYQSVLNYVVYRLPGHHYHEAQDVAQDVYVRVWNRISAGAPLHGTNIGGFLYTTARNLIYDHYKSARVRMGESVSEFADNAIVSPDDPQRAAEDRELSVVLDMMLDRLSPDQAAGLRLQYYENLPLAEVARLMGRNEGAVKALLHRGRTMLRRMASPVAARS